MTGYDFGCAACSGDYHRVTRSLTEEEMSAIAKYREECRKLTSELAQVKGKLDALSDKEIMARRMIEDLRTLLTADVGEFHILCREFEKLWGCELGKHGCSMLLGPGK